MNVLSIQSWVAFGHVGNAAAMFPLQRLGAEVWGIHTVQFSNHPGYGDWAGRAFGGAEVGALVEGVARRGALAGCDAVLSGYLGDAGVGEAVLEAVARVRAANSEALYCCDPVMGDAGVVYVRQGIPELISQRAVGAADVMTPNQFELELLTGLSCASAGAVRAAILALQARMRPGGRGVVLVTSLRTEETAAGSLDVVVADRTACLGLTAPLLPIAPSGAGDAIAAMFLFHLLRSGDAGRAMGDATSSLHGILRRTVAQGSREMALVAAQDEIVNPSLRFGVREY